MSFIRTRWAAVGAAVAVTLGAGGVSLTQAAVGDGDKPVYVSLEQPCRLADTRPDSQIGLKGTPIAAGESNAYEIRVTGDSGDCADESGPAVPADAVGVSLNVTVIAPSAPSGRSYFTVYPADSPLPGTSNLNFVDGQAPFPNKVDVGLSADGKIKIFNFDGTAHVAVDVFGYYVDHHHDDRYYTEAEVDAAIQAAQPILVVEAGDAVTGVTGATTIATATIDVPVDGTVLAESVVALTAAGNSDFEGTCSLSESASPSVGSQIESASGSLSNMRDFAVAAGDSLTVNLVCGGVPGPVDFSASYLALTFVPG